MKKQKKWLSIFLVVCLIGGIGCGIWYHQKRIDERRLSLVYIPKVVDKTNDFWKALILGTPECTFKGSNRRKSRCDPDITIQFYRIQQTVGRSERKRNQDQLY